MRVSLAGGGTDLPSYYETHGGVVLSLAIDLYAHAFISEGALAPDRALTAREGRRLTWVTEQDLPVAGALRERFSLPQGATLTVASEAPPGSGLGFSSAATVALVRACAAAQDRVLSSGEVADLACSLEDTGGRHAAGKQDTYAAAFGGANWMTFAARGIEVTPLAVSPPTLERLTAHLMLFFTGGVRRASLLLEEYNRRIDGHRSDMLLALGEVKRLAHELRAALEQGKTEALGPVLNESWRHKKNFAAGISSPQIDRGYEMALAAGASGGKLLGAGGAGYLLFCCDPARQAAVEAPLLAAGFSRQHFSVAPRP